jgi:hypothetical protein
MSTINDITVPWSIAAEPRPTLEGSSDGGYRTSMTFLVDWPNRLAFLDTVAGTLDTYLIGGISVQRRVPLIHPDYPGMIANGVRVTPIGMEQSTNPYVLAGLYTYAAITVDFASVTYPFAGETPYMTMRREMSGTFETIPDSAMVFASDSSRLTGEIGFFVPTIAYQLTTYHSTVADDNTASIVGKLNNAVFLGRPIGTLRFDGCQDEMAQSSWNQLSYTKTYSVVYRVRPWNEVMRRDGAWEVALSTATSTPKYESGDFNILLR